MCIYRHSCINAYILVNKYSNNTEIQEEKSKTLLFSKLFQPHYRLLPSTKGTVVIMFPSGPFPIYAHIAFFPLYINGIILPSKI